MKTLILICLMAIGVFMSELKAQWVNSGPVGTCYNYKEINDTLFTLGLNRLFYSVDDGISFTVMNTSTTAKINCVNKINGEFWVGTIRGVFRFNHIDSVWVPVTTGLSSTDSYYFIEVSNTRILIGGDLGVYFSDDGGLTWGLIAVSPTSCRDAFVSSNSILLAAQGGPYISYDNGTSFNTINTGLTAIPGCIKVIEINGIIFSQHASQYQVYYSTDTGTTWINSSMAIGNGIGTRPIVIFDNELWWRTAQGTYKFNFQSLNWEPISCIPPNMGFVLWKSGNNYLGFSNEVAGVWLLYSSNLGFSWSVSYNLNCNSVSGKLVYFDSLLAVCTSAEISLNSNFTNWNLLAHRPAIAGNISSFFKVTLNYFVSSSSNGVYKSLDSGQTWTQHTNGLIGSPGGYYFVNDVWASGDTILAATDDGIRISVNGGQSFALANGSTIYEFRDFEEHNGYLYAVGPAGVFRTTNNGGTWTAIPNLTGVYSIHFANEKVFVEKSGICQMADTTDWVMTTIGSNINGGWAGVTSQAGARMAVYDTLVFVVSNMYGIMKMNVNNPGVWVTINAGTPSSYNAGTYSKQEFNNATLAVHNGYLWCGTQGMSTFYRPLSDFGYPPVIVTNTETKAAPIQNCYLVPNPTQNTLRIYGNKGFYSYSIISLEGKTLTQGNAFESAIDVSTLASGVYFLQVNEGGVIQTLRFVKE